MFIMSYIFLGYKGANCYLYIIVKLVVISSNCRIVSVIEILYINFLIIFLVYIKIIDIVLEIRAQSATYKEL